MGLKKMLSCFSLSHAHDKTKKTFLSSLSESFNQSHLPPPDAGHRHLFFEQAIGFGFHLTTPVPGTVTNCIIGSRFWKRLLKPLEMGVVTGPLEPHSLLTWDGILSRSTP